jgi:hypothetical protein
MTSTNTYELAMDRMDQARRAVRHAKREAERIIRQAEDEWTAADAELTRYETSPGLPLKQYRYGADENDMDDLVAEEATS